MTMRDDTRSDYAPRILSVLIHIQQHLDDALDRDALVGIASSDRPCISL